MYVSTVVTGRGGKISIMWLLFPNVRYLFSPGWYRIDVDDSSLITSGEKIGALFDDDWSGMSSFFGFFTTS